MLLPVTVLEFVEILIALAICALLTVALYLYLEHGKYDHFPGPQRDSFWSGHFQSIQKVIQDGGIMDDYFLQMSKRYGPIFRINMWHMTFIIVTDTGLIKELLVSGKFPRSKRLYSKLMEVMGARYFGIGLATELDHQRWMEQRVHLDQWFKPNYLHQLPSHFNEYGDLLIHQLEKYADGRKQAIMTDVFHKVTLYSLCKAAFNMDLGEIDGEPHPFTLDLHSTLEGLAASQSNPYIIYNPLKWAYCQKVRKATRGLREYANTKMTERKQAKERGDYVPRDLLEYIMELKGKFPYVDNDILLDQFVTFLTGGQETISVGLSFVIFLLGQNPECYKKLQNEIDSNVGTKSVITENDLESLPYLDMVIKESLRIYPPLIHTFRETTSDQTLLGHRIPANSDLFVSFYSTTRMEEHVKNPLEFQPERFDPTNPERLDKYVSTPFSMGPHICPGKKFAELEMKILLTKMFQNLDFELVPGQPMGLSDTTSIRPKGGAACFFKRREML